MAPSKAGRSSGPPPSPCPWLPEAPGPRCPAFPDRGARLLLQLFIGFGFPYEGPAPLEAIANGCVFLQSRFSPPHSSLNHEFFRGKPTSREVSGKPPDSGEGGRGDGGLGGGREGAGGWGCLPSAPPSLAVPGPRGLCPCPGQVFSQHPYAENFIGKPHVWTVDYNNSEEFEAAIKAILRTQVRGRRRQHHPEPTRASLL